MFRWAGHPPARVNALSNQLNSNIIISDNITIGPVGTVGRVKGLRFKKEIVNQQQVTENYSMKALLETQDMQAVRDVKVYDVSN